MTQRVRRSEMTCPGHSLKMMQKAAESLADEVIFDLEDACATSQKVSARTTVAEAFRTLKFKPDLIRAYRINAVGTRYCYRDLVDVLETSGTFVDAVVVPKIRSRADVQFVDELITQIELDRGWQLGRIRIEILIETARSLLDVANIASSSARLDSLIFGIADFAGELGVADFRSASHTERFLFARQQLLIAARANGLDAIDSVTVQFKDNAVVEHDARHAASLGFDGKWAIHPNQLPAINAAFSPTKEELEEAQKVVAAYQEADVKDGLGAIVLNDEMVDAATIKVAQKRLAIANRARS